MRNRYVAGTPWGGAEKHPRVTVPNPGGAFYAVCELPIDNADAFCHWMLEHLTWTGTPS